MRQDHSSTRVRTASPMGRTYSIVSTYPPTPCGVATFSAALSGGLAAGGAAVEIVRLGVDGTDPQGAAAARVLRDADVVIVQHEYGIYDGPDGDAVIGLLERLERPSILVAPSHQALGEQGGEQLPGPVVHRGHPPRDRGQHADAQLGAEAALRGGRDGATVPSLGGAPPRYPAKTPLVIRLVWAGRHELPVAPCRLDVSTEPAPGD